MANDYLVNKWKKWYMILDVNHDGKISMEDVEECRQKFSDMHHLDEAKAQKVKDTMSEWWVKFIFRGAEGEITIDQFVGSLNKDFTADKAKFLENITLCFNNLFDVIDYNKDRNISFGELSIAWKAYGHDAIAENKQVFDVYGPVNGEVPLRKIVEAWITYITNDDSTKQCLVSEGLSKTA